MKRYILILSCLILAACAEDVKFNSDLNTTGEGEKIECELSVFLPEYIAANTRSIKEVTSLHLLVFDENGLFLSRNEAILEEGEGDTRKFKVTLLSSESKRIIHFVANYDWTDFPTSHELRGVDEGGIVPKMEQSQNSYWKRVEYKDGLNEETFNNQTISLLRNRAKITVKSDASSFELISFKLFHGVSKGTLAPFTYNGGTQEHTFEEGVLTEALTGEDLNIESTSGNNFIDVFEKNNSDASASQKAFLVVKGRYGGKEGFYKIDLVKNKETGELYNLIRNKHYTVTIEEVNFEGYSSEEEAALHPASNNIFASIELRDFPSISDGNSILKVSSVGDYFVRDNEEKVVAINYYPDKNSTTTDNGKIKIKEIDPENRVTSKWDSSLGELTISKPQIAPGEVKKVSFVVTVEGSDLLRYIDFYLRSPYEYEAELTSRGGDQNSGVEISFKVPKTFLSNLFPVDLKIYTNELYPNIAKNEIAVGFEDGKYFYRYQIREENIKDDERVTLYFKRVANNKEETIKLSSIYYDDVELFLPRE